jgi:RNA polymerase sigma-70 factor (ECF subfamily)
VPVSALSSEDSRHFDEKSEAEESGVQAERQEEIDRLMGEVEKLPLPYREVLMHYYYEDCTYQELAEVLGVSSATINARLTKARQMLRERLRDKTVARQ